MTSVILAYVILLWKVNSVKNHPGVQSRSPALILIGGFALLLDSIINFIIQISDNAGCQCFLGIFTTVTNHYIAWLAVFLRAYRIGLFFDVYERYLDGSEKQQLQQSELRLTMMNADLSTRQAEEEDLILQEFNSLKESRFIKRHMLIFISIISVIGVTSFFVPVIYSIVPVYETQQCSTYFTNPASLINEVLPQNSIVFKINIYSYLLFNWFELFLLVIICYKIRNVRDELSIHKELRWISAFWILCSFCYFMFFSVPSFLDPNLK